MTNCVGDQETWVKLKTKSCFYKWWAEWWRKMFFVLSRAGDKEKILSSHEELNLWPLDSTLWCSTTELESEQRIWKSKVWLLWYNHGYLMVIWCMLWCSTTELELECGTGGLRFNSSWGLRIFSLSNACDKTKNIFLYFFAELKTYYLSYSFYKLNYTCLLIGSYLWSIGNRYIDDLTIEKFFFFII